jgi:signal transduction histidine kinase
MALRLAIKESEISIIDTIPDNLMVKVVPAHLDSILLNLFTNAIKYKLKTESFSRNQLRNQ